MDNIHWISYGNMFYRDNFMDINFVAPMLTIPWTNRGYMIYSTWERNLSKFPFSKDFFADNNNRIS